MVPMWIKSSGDVTGDAHCLQAWKWFMGNGLWQEQGDEALRPPRLPPRCVSSPNHETAAVSGAIITRY